MLKAVRALAFVALTLIQSCSSSANIKAEQKGPPLKAQQLSHLANTLDETSGLAYYANHYWIINDSGNKPQIHGLDDQTYVLRKSVDLKNVDNVDWEDLALDDNYIYILDAGNNNKNRENLQIHRALLTELASSDEKFPIRTQTIEYSYGDEKGAEDFNTRSIDCEALVSIDDELWLFSKDWEDLKTVMYKLNKKEKRQVATRISEFNAGGLITGADYNPRTGKLALLGYTASAFGHSFVWIIPVKEKMPQWELARYHRISPHSQWEAITWSPQNSLIIGSEDSPIGNPTLSELVKDSKKPSSSN